MDKSRFLLILLIEAFELEKRIEMVWAEEEDVEKWHRLNKIRKKAWKRHERRFAKYKKMVEEIR